MDKDKQILGIYEELRGTLASIPDSKTWFDDEGFYDHVRRVIDRIAKICPEIEDIHSYLPSREYSRQRGWIVSVIPTTARLNSLIGRIRGTYGLEVEKNFVSNGHTFIQNQVQSQTQTMNIILELQERIISEIPKHEEGSKERKFLEKLKSSLSSVKGIIDVLALALKIGAEFDLDPSTIHNLLGF